MSNYPAGVNDDDPAFTLPDVETDEMAYCPNEWCDNELLPDDDENEPCGACRATEAADRAYWLRVFAYDRLPTADDLDAYTEPCERGKREGLKWWVEKG